MAVIEIWWGNSDWQVTDGTTVASGPGGYSLGGNLVGDQPLTLTARYFLTRDRLTFGPMRCVSVPLALFSGELEVDTDQSLIGDGDPRIVVRQALQQRVHLNDRLIAEASEETVLVDIKGDKKRKTVALGLHAFPPLAFGLVPNAELRIDLVVSLRPWYHKTRRGSRLQALLQLPQWGLVHGVGG